MRFSKHAQIRMGQRGIPARMAELVCKYGRVEGDKWVLDRKEALAAFNELTAERAALLKVVDKGGVAVVEEGATIVTAFNITGRQRHE